MAKARTFQRLVLFSTLLLASACRGEGTFFSGILDGGGGSGGFAGFGGGFPFDSGMDATGVCVACGAGCFDCGIGCMCDADAGVDAGPGVPWSSPFPNTGAPGWRTSTEPLCGRFGFESQLLERAPVGIWSDARGVFAALRNDSSVLDDMDAGGRRYEQVVIYNNAGAGWQVFDRVPLGPSSVWEDAPRITGLADGPLWLHDVTLELGADNACTLVTFDDASARCNVVNDRVRFVRGVATDRAFAIAGLRTLLVFDGTHWAPHPYAIPGDARALWADASNVIVASNDALYRMTSTVWTREPLPFSGVTAIWARATNDLWLGTEDGEIWQFDGQAWQRISVLGGVSCTHLDAVRGIWGAHDTVFFYGRSTLQRWTGATVENLGNWSCSPSVNSVWINDLWGNSEQEAFLALRDRRGPDSSCDDIIVMHFDGASFHRM